jgi:hypothetical protein
MFRISRDELIVDIEVCDSKRDFFNNGAGDDQGFYFHNFGLAMIERRIDLDKPSEGSPNTLVYYRIWKNANDNIRRIMFHYSSLNDFNVEG